MEVAVTSPCDLCRLSTQVAESERELRFARLTRVWRPLHFGPYDSQGVALYSGSSRATRSGLCCNVGDLYHPGMCDGTMSSSDDVPVPERAYRFALTVTVEDEHEAYDDPEWIADAAWGRELLRGCRESCRSAAVTWGGR